MNKINPIFLNKYISNVNIRFMLPIKSIYLKWEQETISGENVTHKNIDESITKWVPYYYLKNPKINDVKERYISFVFDRDIQDVGYFVFAKSIFNVIYKHINKYDFQYNTSRK